MTDGLGDREPMASRLLGRWREAGRDVVTIAMAKKKSGGRERQKQPLITRIHRAKQDRVVVTPAGSGEPIEGRVREATPAESPSGDSRSVRIQERDAHIIQIF